MPKIGYELASPTVVTRVTRVELMALLFDSEGAVTAQVIDVYEDGTRRGRRFTVDASAFVTGFAGLAGATLEAKVLAFLAAANQLLAAGAVR